MSEFGSGFATCLIQFTFHRARLAEMLASYERMRVRYADLFTDESAVEKWANGASDHLYDLAIPTSGITEAQGNEAKRIQARALDIGHGYRPSSRSDPAEAASLLEHAAAILGAIGVADLDAALAWDEAHGLTPDKGEWSCSEDISRVKAGAS